MAVTRLEDEQFPPLLEQIIFDVSYGLQNSPVAMIPLHQHFIDTLRENISKIRGKFSPEDDCYKRMEVLKGGGFYKSTTWCPA